MSKHLYVHEIFPSISGEAGGGFPQGSYCQFVRFSGCNLRCSWCDTAGTQTFHDCKSLSIKTIVNSLETHPVKNVIITGGEPLLQRIGLDSLIKCLLELNYIVQVETNGTLPLLNIPEKVYWVVDYKTYSSNMTYMMPDLDELKADFEGKRVDVKFVVSDMFDLRQSIDVMKVLNELPIKFIISPLNADTSMINQILSYIKVDNYNLLSKIVISIQLHKLLNMP